MASHGSSAEPRAGSPGGTPEIAALRQVPFFAHLDVHGLEELVAAGHRLSMAPEQVVFAEGDEPDGMYILLEGRAKVLRCNGEGRQLALATFERGSFFGELALLEGRPRSATIVTLEPCELFLVKQEEFLDCLASTSPEVVVRVVAALSRMARDATERLWREELAREKLHADMRIARHRAVGQMVAGVAHELNTPLGIANTAADLIEKRLREPVMADALSRDPAVQRIADDVLEASRLLCSNVWRAHRLVESFKQVSARHVAETVETVDVADVVGDVINLFRLNARRAHLEIRFDDRRDPGDAAWTGSPSHLTQVLLNLLTNVERYAYPDGNGGPVEIELATAALAGRPGVRLTVRDFGCGIPREHASQIFEPFFTTGRGRGGTGLGLAIVHNLVTAVLAGTIRVDSDRGAGTAVIVTVPSKPRRSDAMR